MGSGACRGIESYSTTIREERSIIIISLPLDRENIDAISDGA